MKHHLIFQGEHGQDVHTGRCQWMRSCRQNFTRKNQTHRRIHLNVSSLLTWLKKGDWIGSKLQLRWPNNSFPCDISGYVYVEEHRLWNYVWLNALIRNFFGVFLQSARIEKARELIFKRSLHIKSKHFGIPHTSKGMKIESNWVKW